NAAQLYFVIEKGEQVHSLEQARALALQPATAVPIEEEEEEKEEEYEGEDESAPEEAAVSGSDETAHAADEAGSGPRRRRRRRGGRGGGGRVQQEREGWPQETADVSPTTGDYGHPPMEKPTEDDEPACEH